MPDINTQVAKVPPSPRYYTDSKLRDSCHPCASSKVKCSKEKPTCSRCKSRGTECRYLIMKRPGRRREHSVNHTFNNKKSPLTSPVSKADSSISDNEATKDTSQLNIAVQTTQEPLWGEFPSYGDVTPPTPSSRTNDPYLIFLPNQIQAYPITHDISIEDASDVLNVGGTNPPLENLGSEIEEIDFFMSIKGSSSKTTVFDDNSNSISHTPSDNSSLPIPSKDATSTEYLPEPPLGTGSPRTTGYPSSTSLFPALYLPSPDSQKDQLHSPHSPGNNKVLADFPDLESCTCLDQALSTLKRLSSARACTNNSPARSCSRADASSHSDSTTRAILVENKQGIDVISSVLTCPYTHDSLLLGILAMTTLKILERYAAAARTQPATGTVETAEACTGAGSGPVGGPASNGVANSIVSSLFPSSKERVKQVRTSTSRTLYEGILGGHSDDHEAVLGRKSAQDVLSELHRVQNLVNHLSPRLKPPPPEEERDGLGLLMDGSGKLSTWSRPQQNLTGGNMEDGTTSVMSPFSACTLERLENDLRKNLSALSTEIIDWLRQR